MTELPSDSARYCCNICGTDNVRPPGGLAREGSSCVKCGSSVRLRGLALLVARELTATRLPLPDLPELRGLRGLGMSDLDGFALPLSRKFSYTNTYYHQPPYFDVTKPDATQAETLDFITSSEILEHVPVPVERSFANLAAMLKPGGLLLFTVPYGTESGRADAGSAPVLPVAGKEHFPSLHKSAVIELDGQWVLVNRRVDGEVELFRDLVFHGGDGATLEMRVFTEQRLRELLAGAGFGDVRIAGEPYLPFGIEYADPWSLPIVARKGPAPGAVEKLARERFAELALRYSETFAKLAAKQRDWNVLQAEYTKHVAWAEAKVAELERESRERLEHGSRIEGEFEERTRWALDLKHELEESQGEVARERAAAEARGVRVAELEREAARMKAAADVVNGNVFVRILRSLGMLERTRV